MEVLSKAEGGLLWWSGVSDVTTGAVEILGAVPLWLRYLQPEPMLRRTRFVSDSAGTGAALATYSYAGANPLVFADPSGLYTLMGSCKNYAEGLRIARSYAGCDGDASKASHPSSQCETCDDKIQGCPETRGCNVCLILTDGSPFPLLPSEHVEDDEGNPGNGSTVFQPGTDNVSKTLITIERCETASPYQMAESLLHETLHACRQFTHQEIGDSRSDACSSGCLAAQCMGDSRNTAAKCPRKR